MKMTSWPVSVDRDPIVSAIFEVRFHSEVSGLGDLLPGMLYAHLQERYPVLNSLPASDIPQPVRKSFPDWRFQSVKQMSSRDGKINVNIAESAVNIQVIRPYPGWKVFREVVGEVVGKLLSLGVVRSIERYSLRYQNVIPIATMANTDGLRVAVQLADHKLLDDGLTLRTEIDFKGTRAIVQYVPRMSVSINVNGQQEDVDGTLVDIDALVSGPVPDFGATYMTLIDELHAKEKELFFSLLTESALQNLGPNWED